MNLFEHSSGFRLHIRTGNASGSLAYLNLISADIYRLIPELTSTADSLIGLISADLFRTRLVRLDISSVDMLRHSAITGPLIRASGISEDIRVICS